MIAWLAVRAQQAWLRQCRGIGQLWTAQLTRFAQGFEALQVDGERGRGLGVLMRDAIASHKRGGGGLESSSHKEAQRHFWFQ